MDLKQVGEQTNEIGVFFDRYGFPAGLSIVLCFIIIYLAWTFLIKRIERMAEDVSEQTFKKYQAEIDKDLYKFQTTHQKQIDAIHEVYQKLQTLSGLLHFVMEGEPFTQPMDTSDQLKNLILCRHDFKQEYRKHRLIFGDALSQSMDEFLVAIDNFIRGYESGLMPVPPEPPEEEESGDGLYIAGIWIHGELEELVEKVDSISISIEKEFKAIFGIGA